MGLPARFRALLYLIRPFTLLAPVSVTPLVAWAAVDGALLSSWQTLVHATVTLILANVAANLWNAAADVEVDRAARPDRPVAAGHVTEAEARWIGHAVALFAAFRALTIDAAFGALVAGILAASLAYSFRLKPRKITSWVALGVTRGGLGPLAAWSAFASPIEPRILAFALVGGLLAAALWSVKDLGDADQDRSAWLILLWVLFGGLASIMAAGLFLGGLVGAAAAAGVIGTGAAVVYSGRQIRGHPLAWYVAYGSLILLAAAFALG